MPSPFGLDPPDPDLLPSVVIVRTATVTNVRGVPVPSYTNTVRRAAVLYGGVSPRETAGTSGSVLTGRVLFGPPDPGVTRGDLLVVPPRHAGDPPTPRTGDVWVDTTAGQVLRWTGAAVEVLGPVPVGTSDLGTFAGPGPVDVGGGVVLVCQGPAVDVGDQDTLYRVECGEG